jgi:hypothetical protein
MSSACILQYGRDQILLMTRGWVLEKSGYRVHQVSKYETLFSKLLTEPVDILILCHSLAGSESREALDAASLLRPKCRTLVLVIRGSEWPVERGSAVIGQSLTPRHLLNVTEDLSRGAIIQSH